jgi:DNA repair protein RadC
MDSRKNVIDAKVLFSGGVDKCLIDARVIFREALLQNACAIALAHNHPSGNLRPSDADITVMYKLAEIGQNIGIELVDSIIFNEREFYSMRDGNLL